MNHTPQRAALAWEVRRFYELATRSIEQRLVQRLTEAGITDIRPVHFRVFEYLPPEGARLTDLARRAQTTKQALGYLVDDLVSAGYLERIPDESDGRASLIRLTDRGREMEAIAVGAVAEKDAEWRSAIGEQRYADLGDILTRINDAIDQELHGHG